jgi:formate-dependent nitrite reductase membrane component NrfD
LEDAVTTAGALACVTAAIIVDFVAVIAIFKANEDKAITAASLNTATHTAVVVSHVAVIAGFKTGFVVGEVRPHRAIATTGEGAVVTATVLIIGVAIIAVFMTLCLGVFEISSNPITAACEKTAIGAGIRGNFITIIAFLAGLHFAVAAGTRDVADHHLFRGASGTESKESEVSVSHRDLLPREVQRR